MNLKKRNVEALLVPKEGLAAWQLKEREEAKVNLASGMVMPPLMQLLVSAGGRVSRFESDTEWEVDINKSNPVAQIVINDFKKVGWKDE